MLRPRKDMKEFEYLTLAPLLSTLLPLHPLEHPHEGVVQGLRREAEVQQGCQGHSANQTGGGVKATPSEGNVVTPYSGLSCF